MTLDSFHDSKKFCMFTAFLFQEPPLLLKIDTVLFWMSSSKSGSKTESHS